MIEATITEWCVSSGKDSKTLKTALQRIGVEWEKGEKITLLQFMAAVMGDEKIEKVRNLKLDADLKQIDKDKALGRLYEPEVVKEMIAKAIGLSRQAILSGRAEVPPRANPQDHLTALKAWDTWQDRYFPAIREGMQKDL